MAVQVRRNWTAAQVRELIASAPLASPRYELIDGELLVTPSPNLAHQGVVGEFYAALRAGLEQRGGAVAVTSPSDVELEPERITQPDVYVLPKAEYERGRAQGFPVRDLLLAVEVLSPGSRRYDRVSKLALYQRHVPEYWIVDPDARLVERWRSGDQRPDIVTQTLTWQPAADAPRIQIDLPRLFTNALGDPPNA